MTSDICQTEHLWITVILWARSLQPLVCKIKPICLRPASRPCLLWSQTSIFIHAPLLVFCAQYVLGGAATSLSLSPLSGPALTSSRLLGAHPVCGMSGCVGKFLFVCFPRFRFKTCCLFFPSSGNPPRTPFPSCSSAGCGHRQPSLGHCGILLRSTPVVSPCPRLPSSLATSGLDENRKLTMALSTFKLGIPYYV